MLRRDYLQAEIKKLAEVLARIIGLKREGRFSDANALADDTLQSVFDIHYAEAASTSTEEFEALLHEIKPGPEKLDALAKLLFERVHPFEESPQTDSVLHKILLIYRLLEEEHHIQSLENLNNRDTIGTFLNNRQYE